VFLRYGSQDSFTIFSPAYAAAIRFLGVEDAARLMTLLGQAWWFAAAGAIANRLLGMPRAVLALALIAALPGYYGAWEVFQYAEPFLTPRLYAEAAVLTAIVAALHGRPVLSGGIALLAVSIHPLMGAAGLLVLAAYAAPRTWHALLLALFLGGMLVAALVSTWTPHYPLAIFDDAWLELVRVRSPFLFLSDWGAEAWEGVALSLIPLWILSSGWSEASARKLFRCAVAVGLLGILTTGIGATYFKVVLITQGQAWRWTWVASALIGVAAVGGLPSLWRAGPATRAAILLALSGWFLVGWPAAALLASSVVVWAMRRHIRGTAGRLFLLGCVAIAVISAALWIMSLPLLNRADPSELMGRPALRSIRLLLADGILGTSIATAAWIVISRARMIRPMAVLAVGTLAVAGVATLPDWRRSDYLASLDPRLEVWRETIPADSEVLWPEDPAAAWLLLHRRSYLSYHQTAGVLFSREGSMEMLRRANEVNSLLPPSLAFRAGAAGKTFRLTNRTLATICRRSSVDFVALRYRLAVPRAAPPLRVQQRATRIVEPMYLYDCDQLRRLDEAPPSTL
jgi:hypothetical protein